MRAVRFALFLLLSIGPMRAQNDSDAWMEYIAELADETTDREEQIETLYTELSYLADHPFDLNRVTAEQLGRLPFLSDQQIEEIVTFREKYGEIVSVYELKNMQTMDFRTIRLLTPFVYVGQVSDHRRPATVRNMARYGKHQLQVRYDQSLQQKAGYRPLSDSLPASGSNNGYLGEPFSHSLRYSYAFEEKVQAGFSAEKDAGETFLNGIHKGYDHYSAYLLVRNAGPFKSIAAGDYKVSFGQGLVVSNDFPLSRSGMVTQAEKRSHGFRRHFSTNEADFFRGLAVTAWAGKFDLSLFYSYRYMDAAIDSGRFSSIRTGGLHRLVRERETRHTLPLQALGGNIRYATPNLCIGLTALSYSFGRYKWEPRATPYNVFAFRGSRNTNLSADYLLKNRYVKLYGETAISGNHALASLNELALRPVSWFSFLLSYRYYSKRYQALFANAFAQNSTVQNEQGWYLGLQFVPIPRWQLSASVDIFRHPWLKYDAAAPSVGREYQLRADYGRAASFRIYFRYRYRSKETNRAGSEGNPTAILLSGAQHKYRMQADYDLSPVMSLRSSADAVWYRRDRQTDRGFMLAQQVSYVSASVPVQFHFYAAAFYTDNYNTRIYSYEKNILYALGSSSFYGKGMRVAAVVRWEALPGLQLSAKLAHAQYADRNVIGSGPEQIQGRGKTDLYLLLGWKF